MEISGHRTRAVFDRYHIISERRLREMAGKLEVHLRAKDEKKADKPTADGSVNWVLLGQDTGARQRCKTEHRNARNMELAEGFEPPTL
jgi:hypothetical protein